MEIRLLEKGYKTSDSLYQDFLDGTITEKDEYFSNDTVYVREAPDFPIYMGKGNEEAKKNDFLQAFQIVSQTYLNIDREIIMDETFWHSFLVTHKRDYIIKNYPEVEKGRSTFNNIVLKKFDWENYIYKVILGAQYINDDPKGPNQRYYELIVENLDLYNYIIKSEIFRNDKFLINILDIIDELSLSKVLKAKIKGREDLGDDERIGRRVIFEFNKSYPIVMSPMLEKENLKEIFLMYLSYYYDTENLLTSEKNPSERVMVPNNREINIVADQPNPFVTQVEKDKPIVPDDTKTTEDRNMSERDDSEGHELVTYFKRNNLDYVDNRHKGGSFWAIGDSSIKPFLTPLEVEGIYFTYKPSGGRTTKHRPAWYLYKK